MSLDQLHPGTDVPETVRPVPAISMRCESCGYGVTRSDPPERCPMCGGADWEVDGWRPFSGLLDDLRPRP